MPSATIRPPTTPTAMRYGWLIDRRAASRRRQRVSAIRSRRLRVSSASNRALPLLPGLPVAGRLRRGDGVRVRSAGHLPGRDDLRRQRRSLPTGFEADAVGARAGRTRSARSLRSSSSICELVTSNVPSGCARLAVPCPTARRWSLSASFTDSPCVITSTSSPRATTVATGLARLLQRRDGRPPRGQQAVHHLRSAPRRSPAAPVDRRSRTTFQRPSPRIAATAAATSPTGSARRQPRSAPRRHDAAPRDRPRGRAGTAVGAAAGAGQLLGLLAPRRGSGCSSPSEGSACGRSAAMAAHDVPGLGHGRRAAVAAGQVRDEERLVLRLEGVQRPADGELVEGRVLAGCVGGHRPGSGAGAAPSAPPVISATAPPSSCFEPAHARTASGSSRCRAGCRSAPRPRAGCSRRSRPG